MKIADYFPSKVRFVSFVILYGLFVVPLLLLFFCYQPPTPTGKWPASFLGYFDLSLICGGIGAIRSSEDLANAILKRRARRERRDSRQNSQRPV